MSHNGPRVKGKRSSFCYAFVDELVKRKIRFTAIKESIHFEGKQDLQTKVMVALFGLFAEVERDLISERTREGLASAPRADCLAARRVCWESRGWMGKRKRSAFSCKSRSQRRPSPRLSASRGPPFTALSRQGGYAHILKGYFYTNLGGTLTIRAFPASPRLMFVWRSSPKASRTRSAHASILQQTTCN